MAEFTIRPYQASDRPDVARLAADTAFFGEPVEAYLEDRQLFFDIFYRYYTDLEPQHSFAAWAGNDFGGFLMGSLDTAAQPVRWMGKLLPSTLSRLVRGRYRLGKLTLRYVLRLIRSWVSGENVRCDLRLYPAHLHINVDARWRGQGLGRQLMQTYLDYLISLGVPGVHLHTTDYNRAACRLYESLGFTLLDARPTRLWEGMIDQPLENRCYGLRIG